MLHNVSSLEYLVLEVEDDGLVLGGSGGIPEERLVPSVFLGSCNRSHIRNGHVHVLRVEHRVAHAVLAALADAGGYPFPVEDMAEGLPHLVKVCGFLLSGHIVPVEFFPGNRGVILHERHALVEIPVLHQHEVALQKVRYLFVISRVSPVLGGISFGDDHGRGLEVCKAYYHPLLEQSLLGMLVVYRLGDEHLVFSLQMALQLLCHRNSLYVRKSCPALVWHHIPVAPGKVVQHQGVHIGRGESRPCQISEAILILGKCAPVANKQHHR